MGGRVNAPSPDAQNPSLSEEEFLLFQGFFRELIGISLPPVKRPLVAARLGRRLEALGLATYREYYRVLRSADNAEEVQRSVDLITTNETSFFREPDHFRVLAERIVPSIPQGRKIRIWCGASSTGEEPYTLAMVLSDVLGLDGWSLVATDINREVLDVAGRGLYPIERAKNIPEAFLKSYCLKGKGAREGSMLVDPVLRDRIAFRQMNLLEISPDLRDLDVVFLRNVLIYFDGEARSDILTKVLERIRPGGWLVLGHSESVVGLRITPVQQVAPSVYRKPSKGGST